MSRMLDALRQIESKLGPVEEPISPVMADEDSPCDCTDRATSTQDDPAAVVEPPLAAEPPEAEDTAPEDGPSQPEWISPPTERANVKNRETAESVRLKTDAQPPPASKAAPPERPLETTPPEKPAEAADAADKFGRSSGVVGRAGDLEYSDLARHILAQLPAHRPAALMFTSPGDGEGKTTTLAPLAATLADQFPHEILVVDANFRNPTLGRLLEVEADHGLVDVLTGAAEWQEVVRNTDLERLSVLPGGRSPFADGTPPDGLDLAPLLSELRRNYRLVLFDTASLSHPEVAPMSRFFDATYLVLGLGDTSRDAARQAVRILDQCGGRLLGCVLRAAETSSPA